MRFEGQLADSAFNLPFIFQIYNSALFLRLCRFCPLCPLCPFCPLGCPTYYKRFSEIFIDDSTNLISLYNKHPTTLNQSFTPDFVRATVRICLPFLLFKIVFNKLHEHSHTGIKITYNTLAQ